MSDNKTKISELPLSGTIGSNDVIPIVKNSITKKVKYSVIKNDVLANVDFRGLVPIGSIIGVNPNVNFSKALDTNYWVKCDNTGGNVTVTYSDGTTDSIARPDLSDNRFLQGSTAAGSGGNNSSAHTHDLSAHTHDFTHTHGTTSDSHNHQWLDGLGSAGNLPQITSYSSGMHTFNSAGNQLNFSNPHTTDSYTDNDSHSHTTNSQSTSTSDTPSSDITGAASATENRPLYFNVIYYMRIK